jgi:drug/metabolite transporter (DMT)-like permease
MLDRSRSAGLAVIAAYAGMCAIWGTTWLGIKVALRYAPPITGAGIRFIVAGLVLYGVALIRGRLVAPRELPWKLIGVLAVMLFGLNYILTYTAETRLDSGLVAVLFGTLPFFVFGFAHWLAQERTSARTWIGAMVAFAGVAVISLGGAVSASPLYALAVIGAAASSAFANVYAKRHAHRDPLVTLPPSMALSGIALMLIGMLFERVAWSQVAALPSIAAILYLALFGSSIAFFLNLWVLQRIPAWVVGLSSLIIPVIAVVAGALLGGERFSIRELAGAALVVCGLLVALSQPAYATEEAVTTTQS